MGPQRILVTGGTGFIGSHTCVELLNEGFEVVVIDNLVNSKRTSLERVKEITGRKAVFYEVDLNDTRKLIEVIEKEDIEAVIHFAGYKAVAESVEKPFLYYRNNVSGSISLAKAMIETELKKIIFSSSCTVYGDPEQVPITENEELSPNNPYGRSKWMVEQVFNDIVEAEEWAVCVLRYFNPIGAHPSGLIGEDPKGIPNNLIPYITQVAIGKRKKLYIFGNDYDTHDGTGVRDYIHVVDLAKGHIAALRKIEQLKKGTLTYNLGIGQGYSVLDVVKCFQEQNGQEIPYEITDRRPGDVSKTYADPTLAMDELNWQPEFGLEAMCRDAWNWQERNPNGYSN